MNNKAVALRGRKKNKNYEQALSCIICTYTTVDYVICFDLRILHLSESLLKLLFIAFMYRQCIFTTKFV